MQVRSEQALVIDNLIQGISETALPNYALLH